MDTKVVRLRINELIWYINSKWHGTSRITVSSLGKRLIIATIITVSWIVVYQIRSDYVKNSGNNGIRSIVRHHDGEIKINNDISELIVSDHALIDHYRFLTELLETYSITINGMKFDQEKIGGTGIIKNLVTITMNGDPNRIERFVFSVISKKPAFALKKAAFKLNNEDSDLEVDLQLMIYSNTKE